MTAVSDRDSRPEQPEGQILSDGLFSNLSPIPMTTQERRKRS